jgi:hypothetical protein
MYQKINTFRFVTINSDEFLIVTHYTIYQMIFERSCLEMCLLLINIVNLQFFLEEFRYVNIRSRKIAVSHWYSFCRCANNINSSLYHTKQVP